MFLLKSNCKEQILIVLITDIYVPQAAEQIYHFIHSSERRISSACIPFSIAAPTPIPLSWISQGPSKLPRIPFLT